jgi:hypothetical protein
MAFHLRLVKEAAEGKAGPGRYGRGYELVIVVEDWWSRRTGTPRESQPS